MRIVIVGAGAVGLFLASRLSGSAEVSVIGRGATENTSLQRISIRGAAVHDVTLRVLNVDTQDAKAAVAAADVIVVAVKAHQLRELRGTFQLLTHQTLVLPQNGLGIIEEAQVSGVPTHLPVVRLLCRFGVRKVSPYELQYAGGEGVTVWSAHSGALGSFLEQLRRKGLEVKNALSLADAEWEKALINVFVNPLCTILDAPNRAVIEDSNLSALAYELYKEAYEVARRDGYVGELLARLEVSQIVARFGDNINSHLEDRRRGRQSDMRFLLGETIVRAAQHGVPVPRIHMLYGLYQALVGAN